MVMDSVPQGTTAESSGVLPMLWPFTVTSAPDGCDSSWAAQLAGEARSTAGPDGSPSLLTGDHCRPEGGALETTRLRSLTTFATSNATPRPSRGGQSSAVSVL